MLPVSSSLKKKKKKNEVWVILRPQLLVLKMLSPWEKGSGASETSFCTDVSLQGHKSIGVWMMPGVSECLGWHSALVGAQEGKGWSRGVVSVPSPSPQG